MHIAHTTPFLAAVGGALAAALALSAAGLGAHSRSTQRLVFVERELASPTADLGKRGFSPLDRQTITSDLLDLHGNVVGRLDDDCGITAVGKRAGAVCGYVISLAGGQLVGTRFDAFTAKGDSPQPITGGSGAYVGAKGDVHALRKTERGLEFEIDLVR